MPNSLEARGPELTDMTTHEGPKHSKEAYWQEELLWLRTRGGRAKTDSVRAWHRNQRGVDRVHFIDEAEVASIGSVFQSGIARRQTGGPCRAAAVGSNCYSVSQCKLHAACIDIIGGGTPSRDCDHAQLSCRGFIILLSDAVLRDGGKQAK